MARAQAAAFLLACFSKEQKNGLRGHLLPAKLFRTILSCIQTTHVYEPLTVMLPF